MNMRHIYGVAYAVSQINQRYAVLTHIASIEAFRFVFDSFEHIELRYHEHMSMRCWSAGGRGTTLGTIILRR